MSSTFMALDMTDLLSMICVVTKCSKYSRKIPTTVLHIGDPLLKLWIVYKILCCVEICMHEYGIH